jgi:hypothetical protein
MQSRACVRLLLAVSGFLCFSFGAVQSDELRSFFSPMGLDSFRLALKETEYQSKSQLAADSISETFAKADRSNIDLVAISEQRDVGPPIEIGSDAAQLPSVVVTTTSETPNAPAKTRGGRIVQRYEKSIVRIASLRLSPKRNELRLERSLDADRRPIPPSSLQPLLSNCGPLTPECLANEAWCGC